MVDVMAAVYAFVVVLLAAVDVVAVADTSTTEELVACKLESVVFSPASFFP